MITPTRFGLKYAPIPTLALEYEEDLKSIDDVSGSRSLYIYKEESERHPTPKKWKRVHVVELPQLTRQSEPQTIIQQLQRDNQRFLGPDVVKEEQLKRLLLQLMSRLQGTDRHDAGASATVAIKPDEHEEEEEEEELEARVVEASAELEASSDDPPPRFDAPQDLKPTTTTVSRGHFNTHEESDDEPPAHDAEHLKPNEAEDEDEEEEQEMSPEKPAVQLESPTRNGEEDASDHEEDEKKKKALKSESEVSDEEDIQSEELEYFSEDGSDEDSF